ncbi:glycosyl hydrolase family 61-domain-containing protein [Tuber indicum]|nr:glycosyl hydrolase family 61-domain-containing protein [Tuber indicum]
MKSITAAFAMVGLASAHSVVTHFHINGVPNSDCVRQATSTNPITDLNSENLACNIVKGGDSIAFEWRTDPGIPPAQYPLKDGATPIGVIDDSHKGPCSYYIKKVDDASTASGPGDGWFKVSADGVDSSGTFCTDRIRSRNDPQSASVPKNIPAGDYIFRAEILTLNNAGPASLGGQEEPQFYVGCVQVTVEGTSGNPNVERVSIPGYLSKSSPGVVYDIWNTKDFKSYPIPGPKPLTDSTDSSPAPEVSSPPAPSKNPTAPASNPSDGDDGNSEKTSSLPLESPTPAPSPRGCNGRRRRCKQHERRRHRH